MLHKDDVRYGDLHTLILSEPDSDEAINKKRVRTAIIWLKANNEHYQHFFANYETLFNYFVKNDPRCPTHVPLYNVDFKPIYLNDKVDMLNKLRSGVLIPNTNLAEEDSYVEDEHAIVHPMHIVEAEVNCLRDTYLGYNNPTLETKTWPYLFPFGRGELFKPLL